jgi:preprotein translocase subunit Sec63
MYYIFEKDLAQTAGFQHEAIILSENFVNPVIIEMKSIVHIPKKSLLRRIQNYVSKHFK